jgi:RNA polymerase sigma factor (sigma-70 family)
MSMDDEPLPDSHVRFPTTSWTLVRQLQELSEDRRRELFDHWLRHYWKPLYAYFRSQRQSREQAADLVQGFLHRFLQGDKILQADKPEKRFRDWLLVAARNFLIDDLRKQKAGKRAPPQGIASFEAFRSEDGDAYEPAADDDPQKAYLEAWRRDLLDRAVKAVHEECRRRERLVDYQLFRDYYMTDQAARRSWKELAAAAGLADWRDAARKADWVKARLSRTVRHEIRNYVDTDEEVDDEVRELFG